MQPLFVRLCTAALAFGLLPCWISAQKSSYNYASEPFVGERTDVVYAMNADGTGYMQKTIAVKIQSDSALKQMGIVAMGYASGISHVEFHYVRVRRPDGSVTETPLSGVMDQPAPVTVEAPFYSDLKIAELPVQNLQVGDTLEWEARVVLTQAEAPNEFWGAETFITEGSVIQHESVELRVPAAKAITIWTNSTLGVAPKVSAEGGSKVYRWETSALKPTVGAEAQAAKDARQKHVLTPAEELDAEQGKLPSVAWTTFPNWQAVGEWYRGLEQSRVTADAEIKAKAAELTAGKKTDEEKVKAIYAYVSSQIRYIGIAFGVGRYQPHQATEVLHSQYGDCKDKATLLSAMLSAAGIPSDAALIGAGIRFNESVPSPASFNHLITHLKLNGQDVWLDSTEEVAPYKMMYAVLRDREALLVPPTGTPTLKKTPANPPFASFQTWTAKGTLNAQGISESKITLVERGDEELAIRSAARQVGPAQYDELTQRLLGVIGYAGTESQAAFSSPNDADEPFQMSFNYHREKAGDWDNLRIIPQLAPVPLPMPGDKEPVSAIHLGAPRTETSTAEMKLPAGWTAELPTAVHEKSAFATYDETYRFENGTLYSERKIAILQDKIALKDWAAYKKFSDAVDLGKEDYVQLHTASNVPANNATTPQYPSDPKAAQLVTEASNALGKKDSISAADLLEQAKKINPQQKLLWAELGLLAESRGNRREALMDMMAELSFHPDSYDVYPQVFRLSLAIGEPSTAEKALQMWSEKYPTSPTPLIQLAAMQLANNKPDLAARTADRAMGMLTDDGRKLHPELQLTLGTAQMRTGAMDKGAENLTNLLKTTTNPDFINNAAFELADAGKELALDEAKQRIALAELTKATENLTLDATPDLARARTQMLCAAWDTMGWILFREGKVREAKPYIEAAYMNRQDDELKKHLDEVNAKLGPSGPRRTPTNQELRTYSLGQPGSRRGVAEYRLLIAHGQVEQVKPAGEKTVADADQVLRRARLQALFPAGSDAKLVRNGMLNCYSAECMLVLLP